MAQITWLGHAGFLIASGGKRLAVDAWLDAPTYAGPSLATLQSEVDVVAVSHGHFDHAGDAPKLCKGGATLACIHEVKFWAAQQGVPEDNIVSMNIGGTVDIEGFKLSMVNAVHSGGCPGDDGSIVPGGAAAGWVIECPDGTTIYHAGDTAAFLDMQLIAEMHDIDIALLPIGGHFTMDARGAAKAVELLGVRHVVPMHYGTFPILTGTPAELEAAVGADVTVHALAPGATLDSNPLTR